MDPLAYLGTMPTKCVTIITCYRLTSFSTVSNFGFPFFVPLKKMEGPPTVLCKSLFLTPNNSKETIAEPADLKSNSPAIPGIEIACLNMSMCFCL